MESDPRGDRRAHGIVPPIMGRHPASRQAADPQPPVVDTADRPTRSRPARPLGGALAVVLAVALVGWAGLAVAAAMTGGRSALIAAGPSGFPRSRLRGADSRIARRRRRSARRRPRPRRRSAPASRPRAHGSRRSRSTTRLQAELDRMRSRLGIPGVSATIIFRDGTSWTGVERPRRRRRRASTSPATPRSPSAASARPTPRRSSSRSPATARSTSTSRPRRYLAGLPARPPDHGPDAARPHERPRRLLPPRRRSTRRSRATGRAAWSVERTLRYVAKPYFAPGTSYHYSNTNYLYLGLIAERRDRRSTLGDRAPRAVLRAARPRRDVVPGGREAARADRPRLPVRRARPGRRRRSTSRTGRRSCRSPRSSPPPAAPDRSPPTSADAARWARLLYTGEVLGPEMTAVMLAASTTPPATRRGCPYGLGVQAFPIDGRPTVGHSGTLLGFRAAVRHLPAEATTIAVLTNQSRADPGVIVRALLSVVFAPEPPCLRCQNASA